MLYHTIPTLHPGTDSRDNHQPTHTAPASPAMSCATCQHGCDCRSDYPTAGCEHYACWGPAGTGTCPGVATMIARRASKMFPAATAGAVTAELFGATA